MYVSYLVQVQGLILIHWVIWETNALDLLRLAWWPNNSQIASNFCIIYIIRNWPKILFLLYFGKHPDCCHGYYTSLIVKYQLLPSYWYLQVSTGIPWIVYDTKIFFFMQFLAKNRKFNTLFLLFVYRKHQGSTFLEANLRL